MLTAKERAQKRAVGSVGGVSESAALLLGFEVSILLAALATLIGSYAFAAWKGKPLARFTFTNTGKALALSTPFFALNYGIESLRNQHKYEQRLDAFVASGGATALGAISLLGAPSITATVFGAATGAGLYYAQKGMLRFNEFRAAEPKRAMEEARARRERELQGKQDAIVFKLSNFSASDRRKKELYDRQLLEAEGSVSSSPAPPPPPSPVNAASTVNPNSSSPAAAATVASSVVTIAPPQETSSNVVAKPS